jgi:hypothetical protein
MPKKIPVRPPTKNPTYKQAAAAASRVAKNPNFGSSDLVNPSGNVPGSSFNRDLSQKNANYSAQAAGRKKANLTAANKRKPR